MIKAGSATRVLFLAVLPFVLSACGWEYTQQRSPTMLSSAQPAVHGRKIVPGEANNYEEWLAGEPNLHWDVPWRNAQMQGPAVTETLPTTPVPTSQTTMAVPVASAASPVTTTSTMGGVIQIQQQFPPYSRR